MKVMKLKIQCDDFTSKHGDLTLNNVLPEELIMSMGCLELQELIHAIEKAKGKQYILSAIGEENE